MSHFSTGRLTELTRSGSGAGGVSTYKDVEGGDRDEATGEAEVAYSSPE